MRASQIGAAAPFRHLLVLFQSQALQVQGGVVAVEIRVRRDDAGQARRRFQCEALRQRVVRILAIRSVPPVEDPFLGGSQQRVGRQPIAFLALIDRSVEAGIRLQRSICGGGR